MDKDDGRTGTQHEDILTMVLVRYRVLITEGWDRGARTVSPESEEDLVRLRPARAEIVVVALVMGVAACSDTGSDATGVPGLRAPSETVGVTGAGDECELDGDSTSTEGARKIMEQNITARGWSDVRVEIGDEKNGQRCLSIAGSMNCPEAGLQADFSAVRGVVLDPAGYRDDPDGYGGGYRKEGGDQWEAKVTYSRGGRSNLVTGLLYAGRFVGDIPFGSPIAVCEEL